MDDVEAVVRAAGGFVRASEDLRPRVLETARIQRGERHARRGIRQMTFVVVLLALFTTASRNQWDARQNGGYRSLFAARFGGTSAEILALERKDPSWGIVEAFTDLRQRHAEALRLSL
jgi:hypothetical protein